MKPNDGLLLRISNFETEAHRILAGHEAGVKSRVMTLDDTYARLGLLNIKQEDLLRQALRCTENELYRAAHVMCWAAVMDYIEEILDAHFKDLKIQRPKWFESRPIENVRELAEYVPERQLVEVLQPLKLATKNEVGFFVGLLQRRNECAHPTDYYPGLNETLGYISEALNRINALSQAL